MHIKIGAGTCAPLNPLGTAVPKHLSLDVHIKIAVPKRLYVDLPVLRYTKKVPTCDPRGPGGAKRERSGKAISSSFLVLGLKASEG